NGKTFPDETEACRRSRCLKLYCECFAGEIYCEDCFACENCLNKPDYEDMVLDIRHQIELRNPLAFAPPIVNPSNDSPNGDGNLMNTPSAKHKTGCKCKSDSYCWKEISRFFGGISIEEKLANLNIDEDEETLVQAVEEDVGIEKDYNLCMVG
ncbi:hypothetical protein Golob_014422, partial [Gossypium lobatum]|nr:hypothetical protein [Gossypium lobatum]